MVDPMNYWDDADGVRPDFDDPAVPTSVLVQRWFPLARVVKAFQRAEVMVAPSLQTEGKHYQRAQGIGMGRR